MKKKNRKMEFEDDLEEAFEEDLEEAEEETEEEFEDELEEVKLPPAIMVGIFLGIAVLVVIICVILWKSMQLDKAANEAADWAQQVHSESVESMEELPDHDAASEHGDVVNDRENDTEEADNSRDDVNADAVKEGKADTESEAADTAKEEKDDGSDENASDAKNDAMNGADKTENNMTDNTQAEGNSSTGDDAAAAEMPENVSSKEPVSGTESMHFVETSDVVTAKDVTNLRSLPSTLEAENIIAQLMNGETLTRTGYNNETGWSRLEYNGQTVYAVSSYLTTDLAYKPPVAVSDKNRITTQDGRVVIFEDYDDYVTPKMYVNLRTEPSTSQGGETVKCQIDHGTVIHRISYSADSGWSRVEYNGEILYVVSSMVDQAQAPQ